MAIVDVDRSCQFSADSQPKLSAFSAFCLQCFDTVVWAAERASGHSLSLASVKSRLVLPFWYRLTRVVPEKEPLNVCVCVSQPKSIGLV